MKIAIAKWLISRSIDTGKSIPDWVDRLMRQDPTLAEYQRRSQSLAQSLRLQAEEWVAEESINEEKHPRARRALAYEIGRQTTRLTTVRRDRAWQVAATVAALAVGWWFMTASTVDDRQPAYDGPPPIVAKAISATDLKPILATATASEKVFRKLSLGSHKFVSQLVASTESLGIAQEFAKVEQARQGLQTTGRRISSSLSKLATSLIELASADSN